jgi:formylglycine-generating enzyme required for sulfatase activity
MLKKILIALSLTLATNVYAATDKSWWESFKESIGGKSEAADSSDSKPVEEADQRSSESDRKDQSNKRNSLTAGSDEVARIDLDRAKVAAERKAALLRTLNFPMVSIPGGSFRMGDLSGEGDSDEKPVHSVRVSGFKMSQHEITFAAWDACVSAGGCSYRPDDEGWGRGNRPVIDVSWNDIAQQFIPWLNQVSGKRYRLPSEAEWEYAARAGSSTKYSWGDSIGSNRANCEDCGSQWDLNKTAPVGSFSANRFGLYDMHGNVWEWTQDCWNGTYSGAPTNGSTWTGGDCGRRVSRGGSWFYKHWYLRAASRIYSTVTARSYDDGFRLVQD